MTELRILALEPYSTESHRAFLDGLESNSSHHLSRVELPGHHWKWRMRTSSLILAPLLATRWQGGERWDLIFASEYLNLCEILALLPEGMRELPVVTFFHENQLTYPLQGDERRDIHFALSHVHSIKASRKSWFNSAFHREQFLGALPSALKKVPDLDIALLLEELHSSTTVQHLGTDLESAHARRFPGGDPVILWPHRWEFDKNPELMIDTVLSLWDEGHRFRLRILGPESEAGKPGLERISQRLGDHLDVPGFIRDRSAYVASISDCDIVLSTARHEFFGLATLEAMRRGVLPVVPGDLAYPELLPPQPLETSRYLWDRPEGPGETLKRALVAVRENLWWEERKRIVAATDRFSWETLASSYDDAFSSLVSGEMPASLS